MSFLDNLNNAVTGVNDTVNESQTWAKIMAWTNIVTAVLMLFTFAFNLSKSK